MATTTSTDFTAAAHAVLHRLTGNAEASFRDGQLAAISALVNDRRRVLVVQRTGWGKSAVYFVATRLLRDAGYGPTVLVSPLLSLMRDQVAAARRAGIHAVTMNSSNAHEWQDISQDLHNGVVDVLLISPERLSNPDFAQHQLPTLVAKCGLVVIDEAHCISDWGHDFRPDYRAIRALLQRLPHKHPVLATTATANERVVTDVVEQLAGGHDVLTIRGPLGRRSLRLGVLELPDDDARLAWLVTHVPALTGSGIIYAMTVNAAEDMAQVLRHNGIEVQAYTGRTDSATREDLERALLANEVKALVATSALGMGFDKPDLGFVIHVGAPSSPISYYQQVGRAGRATESADALLLPTAGQERIWEYFATSTIPDPEDCEAVLTTLRASTTPVSTAALEPVTKGKRSANEILLKNLAIEGAVERVAGGWQLGSAPWVYDSHRYAHVAQVRQHEQQLMLEYQRTTQCRMQFLQSALDDATAAPCGRCDNCAGVWFPTHGQPVAALPPASAVGVEIQPRKMWPSNMQRLGVDARGRISAAEQHAPGFALGRLSDLGIGGRLSAMLSADAPPEPWLLDAAVDVLRQWTWHERPQVVMTMPPGQYPQLLAGTAAALAQVGRLDFMGALTDTRPDTVDRTDVNSAYRVSAVWERFSCTSAQQERLATQTPVVLLVCPTLSSGWSLTVACRTLRLTGARTVLPLVLASTH